MKISMEKEGAGNKSIFGKIGIFSLTLLAASSAVYFLAPVIRSHADSSAEADFDVEINEVMSLVLDKNTLNLNVNPNSFVQGTVNAVVSTNSQYGYTLTLEDTDDNTNMAHTNTNISSVVTSDFEDKKTSAEMDTNSWGFSINATDFRKIPVNGSPFSIKRTSLPMETANETVAVDFGAKVGNITAGTYADTVLFTLYTNGQESAPPTPPMQDFDCDTIANGNGATVRDTRDGKTYNIAKFGDGRCWMTQNLRTVGPLDLTPENSNVSSNWTLPAQPTGTEYGSAHDEYFVAHSDVYNEIEYKDSHDVEIGVHYNYYTATAGTISEVYDKTVATNSICPKGWKIPTTQEYADMFEAENLYVRGVTHALRANRPPYNFVFSGYWEMIGVAPTAIDEYGIWFTADPYPWDNQESGTGKYRNSVIVAYNDNIQMNYSGERRRGYSIRCVSE